jgi:hypothetical protein
MPQEYPTLQIEKTRRLDKLFGNPTILDRNLIPLPEGRKKRGVPSTSMQLVPSTLRPIASHEETTHGTTD